LGFALTQEGWLLATLAHHARESHHRGPLTAELASQIGIELMWGAAGLIMLGGLVIWKIVNIDV